MVCVRFQDRDASQGERDASTALKSRCGLRLMSFSASARCWVVEDMVAEGWRLEMETEMGFVVEKKWLRLDGSEGRIEVLNTCLAVNLLLDIDDGWAIASIRGKHNIYICGTKLENTGYGICKADADN